MAVAGGRRLWTWLKEGLIVLALMLGVQGFLERDLLAGSVRAPLLMQSIPTLSGGVEPLVLSDKKRTLIFFFAPWCHVCAADMPNLNRLAREDGDVQIRLIALSWESVESVRTFIDTHDWRGTVLLGTDDIAKAYQVSAFPTYYVLDEQGTIRSSSRGYATYLGLWIRLRW